MKEFESKLIGRCRKPEATNVNQTEWFTPTFLNFNFGEYIPNLRWYLSKSKYLWNIKYAAFMYVSLILNLVSFNIRTWSTFQNFSTNQENESKVPFYCLLWCTMVFSSLIHFRIPKKIIDKGSIRTLPTKSLSSRERWNVLISFAIIAKTTPSL